MKKRLFKWTTRIFVICVATFVFYFLSQSIMEVVDIQYTMNSIWNLKAFVKPLAEYQMEHGELPYASTMEELQAILEIHDYPFKTSNPPLHDIQYFPTVTHEKPYICYWESNEKWGIMRFLRSKHKRHQVLLVWEDFTINWSNQGLDEFVEAHRKYLVRPEDQ